MLYEMVCALSSRSKTKEVHTATKLMDALRQSGAWRAAGERAPWSTHLPGMLECALDGCGGDKVPHLCPLELLC